MKKAFFKYFLFLLVFVLSAYTKLQANEISQDNCLPCLEQASIHKSPVSQKLNISYPVSEDWFDLKVTEIEIEESEKVISKKKERKNPFVGVPSVLEHHFNINNKSLIPEVFFCCTLFIKRYILFQVFRI